MARCPFAVWKPISGSSGRHLGGPFKIVHHTTEGHSADGAMAAYAAKRADPHFTVDAKTIYQHVDTGESARALVNRSGGVQTNRDAAIQIELVGFAHRPKDPVALTQVARLCRWIESTHDVPRQWPSGPPKPPDLPGTGARISGAFLVIAVLLVGGGLALVRRGQRDGNA